MAPSRVRSRKLNELEKEVIWKKRKRKMESLGEWKSSRSFKISEMTAHIWAATSLSIARVRSTQVSEHNGSRRDNGGMAGRRNRAHTLVAHHQVCQTLKENKSTVSREQGIMGSCVTLTRRHLWQSRCLCYLRRVGIGNSGAERKRRVHRQG